MAEKDFGNDYVEFHPDADGDSEVCLDGWFTIEQLHNIANELERLEKIEKENEYDN